MIRNCCSLLLLALLATAFGCRACDGCYESGPIVNGSGVPTCGCEVRSGSALGGPTGQPMYGPAPQTAPQMVPVR